ncbi:hypothetical protein Rpal_4822 [Rhodopseudomonas palustris TIE-1]|nr:hypothetical protein Rpal_4822 [Rhodopseudomonas palustris TIE-1]
MFNSRYGILCTAAKLRLWRALYRVQNFDFAGGIAMVTAAGTGR